MARARQARGGEEDLPRGPVPPPPCAAHRHPPRHSISTRSRWSRSPRKCGATRAPGESGGELGSRAAGLAGAGFACGRGVPGGQRGGARARRRGLRGPQ
eukprot:11847474-Alexandrium_andersonii.AAC.1